MKKWLAILDEIERDREHGALWLALRSIDAFEHLVENLWGLSELRKELEELVEAMKRVRPSMASLKNAAIISSSIVKKFIEESRSLTEVLEELRSFKSYLEKSKIEVARKAVELLQEHSTFLTHSLSSTILEFFKSLNSKKLVIVTESRPRCEGVTTARQLAMMGHKVKLIADASAYQASKIFKVEVFVFGVDTALRDGHVVNKVGTAQIALALDDLGIRSVALCESIKIDPEASVDSVAIEVKEAKELLSEVVEFEPFNVYFDVTPPKVIHAIVMEDGPHYHPFNLKPLAYTFWS